MNLTQERKVDTMISRQNYNDLLERFWDVASWAMWLKPIGDRPKSNVGNLSIFNDPNLLEKINKGFVFVGLQKEVPWKCLTQA